MNFPVPSKGLFVNSHCVLNLAWLTGWNLGGGLRTAGEGTHPAAWESLRLGGQAGRHPRNAPPLSHGPSARVQFPALFSRWRPKQRRSQPGLGSKASGQPCQVVVSFPQYEESLGPSFLLGTPEVSPPTYVTLSSLPLASQGKAGEKNPPFSRLLPSFLISSFLEAAGQEGGGL